MLRDLFKSARESAMRVAQLEARVNRICEWTPIEDGCTVYNVGCQDGHEEFHLTEGLDLWPFCPWCGGKVSVVEGFESDAGGVSPADSKPTM
jgi:hypothetical protein